MFTKNWYMGLAIGADPVNNPTSTDWPDIKNLSGDSPTKMVSSYFLYWTSFCNSNKNYFYPTLYSALSANTGYGGVIFGTGTTAPTVDDYCLSGDLITTISATASVTRTPDDTGCTFTGAYTITNTGSEEITIGEVGLIAATGNQSQAAYKCLVERTVLDSPVTIPAGGVGQVTYTIRMNYPT